MPSVGSVSKEVSPLSFSQSPPLDSQLKFDHFLDLFEKQLNIHADNLALSANQEDLTYAGLQKKSAAYACYLVSQGIQVDDIVAVILPRTLDLIPILIAIMRVGAIYVPINPAHPAKSIDLIIEDAKPDLIVCDEFSVSVAERFSSLKQWNLELFNKEYTNEELALVKNFPRGKTAYIIYTSGSTGKPKGVRISHQTLCAFLLAIQNEIQCEAGDRFAAITTICFDIAGLEMFLPLTLGAAVIFVPLEASYNGAELTDFLERNKVSVFQATPATYRLLIAGKWAKTAWLKKILCGGEALPEKLAKQLLTVAADVWNVYGPTEATIWSTCKKLSTVSGTPSIGKPIAGTNCYIFDDKKALVPLGDEGELYISGHGLAEGYHGAPEKTGERFFEVFIDGQQKERVYRTGDKARINSQGEIEYLGRIDFQVKIRGYRVELQEIEFIAMSHPQVDEFAAITYLDGAGENAICGYYTMVADTVLPQNKLRTFLAENLANYKVPSYFISVVEMPLNTNGKIDRKALPTPQDNATKPKTQSKHIHDFDRHIHKAWCDVLQIERCGDDGDFFLLGGHSISAYLLIKKVEDFSGISVPMSLLFKNPKFGGFLKALRRQSDAPVGTKVPLNILKDSTKPEETVYFICGINLYQSLADALPKTMQANAIYVELEQRFLLEDYTKKSDAKKGKEGRSLTTKKLAEHYVKSILSDKHETPIDLCGISYGGMLALEVASQLQKKGVMVRTVYMLDSVLPSGYQKTILFSLLRSVRDFYFLISKKTSRIPLLGKLTHLLDIFFQGTQGKRVLHQQEKNLEAAIATVDPQAIEYSGEIVLMKAKAHTAYSKGITFKSDYGWQEALNRSIEIHTVPGDHIGMINQENAHNVAKIMQQKSHNG